MREDHPLNLVISSLLELLGESLRSVVGGTVVVPARYCPVPLRYQIVLRQVERSFAIYSCLEHS